MEDGGGELDVTKMTGALGHVLGAGLALELTVDGAKTRIVEAELAGLSLLCIHRLGVLNVSNTHALDLVRRQDSELDLLDRLDGRTRVREIQVRHLVGLLVISCIERQRGFDD